MRALLRSFRYAGSGVLWAVRTQRNLRIHLTALVLVVFFGFLAELTAERWGLVLLCSAQVIALELVNSALESACDAITREENPWIGHAKDAAAGAVLISAIGAIALALLLAAEKHWACVRRVGARLVQHPWLLAVLALMLALGAAFVFVPEYRKNK